MKSSSVVGRGKRYASRGPLHFIVTVIFVMFGRYACAENPFVNPEFWSHATAKDVETAIEKGADPNGESQFGSTALEKAMVFSNNPKAISRLIELGASITNENSSGETPLMFAAGKGEIMPIVVLLLHGTDPRQRGRGERTALHSAATSFDVISNDPQKTIYLLVKNGADINAADCVSETPLLALMSRSLELVRLRKSMEAESFNTIMQRNIQTERWLIELGANVCVTNSWSHCTPLMYAAAYCGADRIRWFLDQGVDPSVKDRDGNTALHYAELYNTDTNVINLLRSVLTKPEEESLIQKGETNRTVGGAQP